MFTAKESHLAGLARLVVHHPDHGGTPADFTGLVLVGVVPVEGNLGRWGRSHAPAGSQIHGERAHLFGLLSEFDDAPQRHLSGVRAVVVVSVGELTKLVDQKP